MDITSLTTSSRRRALCYWISTAIILFVMVSGAVAEWTHRWGTLETHTVLGYPTYFLTIIGSWKALGALALVVPGFTRLKEWAYAGIFFNMTGAFISHAVVGDPVYHLFATGSITVLVVTSWALRPPTRTLGVLFPVRGVDDGSLRPRIRHVREVIAGRSGPPTP